MFRGSVPYLLVLALWLPGAALSENAADLIAGALADSEQHEALANEGAKASFFCANCHGEDGNSRIGEVPNLAGQHPVYIHNQISAFVQGVRKDPFMEGLMRVLSEREKASIAVYYANSSVRPATAQAGSRADEGARFYVEFCARCHGDRARGSTEYPRLAGQQPAYLRINLQRYLTMSGERIYPAMTGAVRQLGERNFDAVIDYLSSLD